MLPELVSQLKRTFILTRFRRLWRQRNPANDTLAKNVFPLELVHVGEKTYGPLEVFSWGQDGEGLRIGRYVSISQGVKFLLGGNHAIDAYTTYPVRARLLGSVADSRTKGQITVEDDVWIGMDALILSGVTIGRGAVVGARAVVSRDVPPLAVVVGNPARVVKYRFSGELADSILATALEDLANCVSEENASLFDQPLTPLSLVEIRSACGPSHGRAREGSAHAE